MVENIILILLVVVYIINTLFYGKVFLKVFDGFSYDNNSEKAVYLFAFGNIALSLLFFYLGFLNLLYKNILLFLYCLPILYLIKEVAALGSRLVLRIIFEKLKILKTTVKRNYVFYGCLLFVFFPLVPHLFLYPTSWDSLAYHLALPKMYLVEHAFAFKDWYPESGYPISVEAIFAMGEVFGEPRLSNFIVFSFVLSIVFYIFYGLRQRFTKSVLFLSVFVFLLRTTFYSEVAVNPNVDYPFALFGILTGVTLIKLMEKKNLVSLALLIVLSFYCFLIKYTGAIIVFASCAVLVFYIFSNKLKVNNKSFSILSAKGPIFLLLSISTLVASLFWVTRNAVNTSDPVYPYFTSYFPTKEKQLGLPEITGTIMAENNYWEQSLLKFLKHEDQALDYLFLFDRYSTYFLMLVMFMVFCFSKNLFLKHVALFTLIFVFVITKSVGPLFRYYLPIYGLSALVLSWLFIQLLAHKNIIFKFGALTCLAFIFGLVDTAYIKRNLMFVNFPKREQLYYLLPARQKEMLKIQNNWEAIEYVNQNFSAGDTILVFFDNRIYYYNVNVIYGHPKAFFSKYETRGVELEYKNVKDREVNYILENKEWGVPKGFDKATYDLFINKYTLKVLENKSVVLYKID